MGFGHQMAFDTNTLSALAGRLSLGEETLAEGGFAAKTVFFPDCFMTEPLLLFISASITSYD